MYIVCTVPFVQSVLRICGDLDISVLRKTLDEIVQGHAALRLSAFPNLALPSSERSMRLRRFARTGLVEPGAYLQSIEPFSGIGLRIVEMKPGSFAQVLVKEILREDASSEFDEPPRLRASLLTDRDKEHFVLFTLDPMVCDEWSVQVIQKDVEAVYSCFLRGEKIPIIEEVSFIDFVFWQGLARRTGYFEPSANYWREEWVRFGSARIGYYDLPLARPAQLGTLPRWQVTQCALDTGSSETIRALAHRLGAEPQAIFLTALSVLLFFCTGKRRIGVWSMFSNRAREGTRRTVGHLSNSHLIGVEIASSDTSCRDIVGSCPELRCDLGSSPKSVIAVKGL